LAFALPEAATGAGIVDALERDLAARRAGSRWRARRVVESAPGASLTIDGRPMLAFASNDYLGLAGDARLARAAGDAAARWGVGAGASHLVSGHFAPHQALEDELAAFVAPCHGARALHFSSGYLANLAILTGLCDRGDTIVADRLNHACLNDGALLSRARFMRYAHGDVAGLAARLAAAPAGRRLIATDAVFSMDGDLAPLRELQALADEHDALLVVDDAHGFGVLGDGRGSVAEAGLASPRIVYMGTLGKAAGVCGAFVAAHPAVIETLLQTARPYIYTTATPPLIAEVLRESLRIVRAEEARRTHLRQLVARFRAGAGGLPWQLGASRTPIQPLIVGDDADASALAASLWQAGIFVPAIRPPTVPERTARLRVSLTAAHTDAHVDRLLDALRAAAERRR
jgi:8-amino-7-oxononanoate synthase